MTLKLKNKIFVILSFFVALIIAFLIVIANPQWYSFPYKLKYKTFLVYHDKPLPNATITVLDQAEILIKKSSFYRPDLNFRVFLRSDFNKYNLLPFQFSELGYGRSVQMLSDNIYIFRSDIETNSSHDGMGGTRSLSSVVAHEIVHVLIEKRFGYLKTRLRPFFKKYEFSQLGYLWKEEGYAEYIVGGGTTFKTFEDGIAILSGRKKSQYGIYDIEYLKYFVAVKYLLEVEKIEETSLFQDDLILDDVIFRAIKHYQK